MPQRDVRTLVLDIQSACSLIQRFTVARDLAGYLADPMLRSAVERQFEIIGEALSRALALQPGLAQRITDTRSIIAFRNVLVHGYAAVADETVWGIVQGKLPTLVREIAALTSAPPAAAED